MARYKYIKDRNREFSNKYCDPSLTQTLQSNGGEMHSCYLLYPYIYLVMLRTRAPTALHYKKWEMLQREIGEATLK